MEQLYKIALEVELPESDNTLSFTFIALPKGSRMLIKDTYLKQLLKICDENGHYFTISNIKDALTSHGEPLSAIFKNYYILLYTKKESGNKRGILISYSEDNKWLVGASWPMSFRDIAIVNPKDLKRDVENLILHPEKFENVNVISEEW
ncbi:MAG: hypothetical protein ACFFCS_07215, partial [Candidatus Hodarchaeota archaeon]